MTDPESRRRSMTPRIRRLLDARDEIMGDSADDPAFLHAVLAQTSLPYRAPDSATEYIRRNGRASLIVQAGFLLDPETREPRKQGLPYGAKPRLLMIHACSEAVRRQSPIVPIADSMSAFMRQLGLPVTGGKRGSIGVFKEQLNRLAAARMQIIWAGDDRGSTINTSPIRRLDVWFPSDHRQRVLWPSEIELSAEFFADLKDHALPLDPRGLRALQHNARALDLYTWMAARLPRVRSAKGDFVSWAALHGQFGGDVSDKRTFRRQFKEAMRQACAAYPFAQVEDVEGGLRLHRSPPPVGPRKIARHS